MSAEVTAWCPAKAVRTARRTSRSAGSDAEAHFAGPTTAEPARSTRIASNGAFVEDQRREDSDNLGRHAGDAAGNPVLSSPSLVARAPVPPSRRLEEREAAAPLVLAACLHDHNRSGAFGHDRLRHDLSQGTKQRHRHEMTDDVARGQRRRSAGVQDAALWRRDLTGRNDPSLFGTSGVIAALIANVVYTVV